MIRFFAFPPLVQVLLAGAFLIRTSFFMVWPFLSVILIRRFGMPPSEVGLILGLAATAGSIMGFYLGNLSDRFGRPRIMIAGCCGSILACLTLASADSVPFYALGAVLVGLSRSAIESPGSALIAELIDEQPVRELAFHARYFLANVGAAAGPLIGFTFGLSTQQPTFLIAAAAYVVFATALVIGFRRTPIPLSHHAREDARLQNAIRTLNQDRPFLMLILASFLAYIAYSQVESTLVQYLNQGGRNEGLRVATAIVATNGLTIILFQFPLLRLLRGYDLYLRIYAGMALFVAGFVGYVFMPIENFAGWIAATWVLSMGEAILFPTLNLQADRMARPHLRGSYFGAVTLAGLGFAAGPPIGGAMLQYLGGPAAFALTAAITVLGGLSYWQSSRLRKAVTGPPPEPLAFNASGSTSQQGGGDG